MSSDSIIAGAPGRRRSMSDIGASADADLVRRFKAGEQSVLVEIIRRHQRRIFFLVLRYVHSHADAEEVTADTFIRAHRGLDCFRGDSSLATWLNQIAMNLARNRYWHLQRRDELARSFDAPLAAGANATLAEVVASNAPDPSQEMAGREHSSIIDHCIQNLPARQREILALRIVRGCSYDEIALALGLYMGTVKSRIARARESLRAQIAAVHAELGGA